MSSPGRAGFTLLEVLAAVMILSIWYMIIMNSAALGLRSEFESRRRIEAGRIADHKLAELEAQVLAGVIPELGNESEELEEYEIKWAVAPFSLGVGGHKTKLPGDEEEPKNLRQFITFHAPSLGRLLRAISVRVSWYEGDSELSVVRSTFAFDQTSAAELYDQAGLGKDDDADQDADAARETGDDDTRSSFGGTRDDTRSSFGPGDGGDSSNSRSRSPGRVR